LELKAVWAARTLDSVALLTAGLASPEAPFRKR
jgi:hypothetical protein